MKRLYVFTLAFSAFLLFSVEPMAARALLPQLGGSSGIWLGSLAFFQVVLLAGYSYSAMLTRAGVAPQRAAAVHLALLAAACLSLIAPLGGILRWAPGWEAGWRLFALLSMLAGLPFFALSTSAPLLQVWYARREGAEVPYRFFAYSNAASLLALLGYPLLLETHLGLHAQLAWWKAGFAVFAALGALLAWRSRNSVGAAPTSSETQVSTWQRLFWFALPAAASLQLAAVTQHLTEDVASMPLLWVVPLVAYLLSFILAFEFPRLYNRSVVVRTLAVLVFALGYFLTKTAVNVPIGISIALFTAELFVAAWFCHAELFALRPQAAAHATGFYLLLAAGGAAGTLWVAVVMPFLTRSNFDLPIAFLLTLLVALAVTQRDGWPTRLLWTGGAGFLLYVLVVMHAQLTRDTLFRGRNFYGSLRVRQTQYPPQAFLSRSLFNGRIQHGMQWFSTEFRDVPLTYYAPASGIGLALRAPAFASSPRSVGVIGLGAGTLAAYGRRGDRVRFYEINPMVTDVAQHLFTFTRDTPAQVAIVPGDARLSLAAEPSSVRFDVIVVDAFSGDSIPTHLLTREALALYVSHLAPGGLLAFHISNQYLNLAPVIARLAEEWQATSHRATFAREIDSGPEESRGEALASWVLVTQSGDFFSQPGLTGAKPIAIRTAVPLWTDDRFSLLPILRWIGR